MPQFQLSSKSYDEFKKVLSHLPPIFETLREYIEKQKKVSGSEEQGIVNAVDEWFIDQVQKPEVQNVVNSYEYYRDILINTMNSPDALQLVLALGAHVREYETKAAVSATPPAAVILTAAQSEESLAPQDRAVASTADAFKTPPDEPHKDDARTPILAKSSRSSDAHTLAPAALTDEKEFNPLIHGSNSSLFAFLGRTEFTLLPPVEMMTRHQMAPMSGEISRPLGGGLDAFSQTDRICFGRMNAKGAFKYGLDRVLESYAKPDTNTDRDPKYNANEAIHLLKRYQENSLKSAYENINVILIYFARAKQMGSDPGMGQQIIKELNAVIQSHYLLMLFATHIHPNIKLFPTDDGASISLKDAFSHHFTLEKFVEKIIGANIDIEEIYNNPSPENLIKILSLLELPEKSRVADPRGHERDITLPHRQYFTLEKPNREKSKTKFGKYDIMTLARNDRSNQKIDRFLWDIFTNEIEIEQELFKTIILSRTNNLKERLKTIETLEEKSIEKAHFSEEEQSFLQKPFPIILVMTSEDKVSFADTSSDEYRVYQGLKIGKDITMIATDTPEHQYAIKQFLSRNADDVTEVVLFDQLEESQKSGKKPYAQYQPPKKPLESAASQPAEPAYATTTRPAFLLWAAASSTHNNQPIKDPFEAPIPAERSANVVRSVP